MRQIHNLLVIVVALSTCCGSAIVSASNQLTGHPSPYLALHADDPVLWQNWQAKAEPVIPIAHGKWVIEDLVFYSPMTLWLRVAQIAQIAQMLLMGRMRKVKAPPNAPCKGNEVIEILGE